MKVGITGQSGFIGTHLARAVESAADMELVPFEDSFFGSEPELREFVRQCEVIVHLAAMSRAPSEDELYDTNMGLVKKLIAALDAEHVAPHVMFSSSTHEARDTAYGRAKRDGRAALSAWAEDRGGTFTGFIFPNVYGPGARVHYASFIANFAWELNHGGKPTIQIDAPIRLIYIDNLVDIIMSTMRGKFINDNSSGLRISRYDVPCDFEKKVSGILSLFESFKVAPPVSNDANIENLYNTFDSYK